MSSSNSKDKEVKKRYFTWNPMMDTILSEAFINQLNEGNRLDGKCAWKSIAWTTAINALNKELGINVTKQNIQSRLKTWEKHYDIVSKMLGQSGFSWDFSKGRVDVTESVWNEYVKVHPDAAPYRTRIVIDNWEDICQLFAQDRANGEGAQTTAEVELEMELNQESFDLEETIGTTEGNVRSLEDDDMHSLGGESRQGKSNASSSSISRLKKRKHSGSQALYDVLSRMAESLDRFMNSDAPNATTQMVLDELSKVEDLNQTMLLKAVDLFMNDQRKFETLVGLPNELKAQYVLMQLDLV